MHIKNEHTEKLQRYKLMFTEMNPFAAENQTLRSYQSM